ncbi:uncharacterized protein LOC115003588 [Cottoperca gobio]|uniref:Uncharacterized protein LOC115003588 n=1 Tax=Cottoperca gobio TaxID=56716 RepID=A0A6J2P759_COTGO|nr:uncharacterized protein LOC115003588 [Cottoperca gobio]XP_029281301.1 uncharacterized protein LOC115003588 [Cottoperca gobio]
MYNSSHSVEQFLHSPDVMIPLYATNIEDPQEELCFSFDIDGVVLEISALAAIKSSVHYLKMPHFESRHLIHKFHHLKKHLPLQGLSGNAMKCLRAMLGVTLGHVDGGYFLDLAAVPRDLKQPDMRLADEKWLREVVLEILNAIRADFVAKLRALPVREKSRPTIQKNSLCQLDKMNILAQDQEFILQILDTCIQRTVDSHHFRIIVTLQKYGMKDRRTINVEEIVDTAHITSMSVHAACNIKAKDQNVAMLWSRSGLQDLVGVRGSLFTAMGMHEAVNFQTCTDHRMMDISRELRQLCVPASIIFLQLYVDSPHLHIRNPFKHPVSGVIATCGLSHPQFWKAMTSRAMGYLDHMEDLAEKMLCPFVLRMEQVAVFGGSQGIPSMLVPAEFFSLRKVRYFFYKNPVVIPIGRAEDGLTLMEILHNVVIFLVRSLRQLFNQHANVGGYKPSWQAFQFELALEEFFYGHPLCHTDYQLTVSLGTSSTNPNSLTNERGFLGLAPYNSASVGETSPPLRHWTRDDLQVTRIERLFPLSNTLEAEPPVIGAALVFVLLGDLYKRNDRLSIPMLQGPQCPGTLKGHVTLEKFCQELATRDAFPPPCTFRRTRELITRAGKDVKTCLESGFIEHNIRFFADVKFRDTNKSKRITWNFKDYVEVHPDDQAPSLDSRAASMVGDICIEIERRDLTYPRNTERYREHGMPWLLAVMRRLPATLGKDKTFKVLTFISCVALVMNGDYISYQHLATLMKDMQMAQSDLQKLQIQSQFLLPKVYKMSIWRLHDAIPWRMVLRRNPPALPPQKRPEEEVIEQPYEDVQAVDEAYQHTPCTSRSKFLPDTKRTVWSSMEMSFVNLDTETNMEEAYRDYLDKCKRADIPARTKTSFRFKRKKMTEDD